VDVLVDRLDLFVEEEDRHAEQKAKAVARRRGIQTLTTVGRRTASTTNRQRTPLTREEGARRLLRRLTSSEEVAEQGSFLRSWASR